MHSLWSSAMLRLDQVLPSSLDSLQAAGEIQMLKDYMTLVCQVLMERGLDTSQLTVYVDTLQPKFGQLLRKDSGGQIEAAVRGDRYEPMILETRAQVEYGKRRRATRR